MNSEQRTDPGTDGGDGHAIFDSGPGAIKRALDNQIRRQTKTVEVTFRFDPRHLIRAVKSANAALHNLDKPLSIPSAQEIVMRQELGEFDG